MRTVFSFFKHAAIAAAVLALVAGSAQQADAGATIASPGTTIALGVEPEGHLNTTAGPIFTGNASGGALGIAYNFGTPAVPDWRDATSPGCLCEGWGVSTDFGGGHAGYANVSVDGEVNLTVDSFTSTPASITSTVSLTSLPDLVVTQHYKPAPAVEDYLFVNEVTIKNNSLDIYPDVRYVRVMDWDIPPTEFSERVSIVGTATTTLLEKSHNNGFATANPLAFPDGSISPFPPIDADFLYAGPADHGGYFRFNFGDLAPGEEHKFNIFYGAAANEAEILLALGAVGIELYSLGQNGGASWTSEPTFAFGFKGVGGVPVLPGGEEIPEPATLVLLSTGLLGMVGYARRRR